MGAIHYLTFFSKEYDLETKSSVAMRSVWRMKSLYLHDRKDNSIDNKSHIHAYTHLPSSFFYVYKGLLISSRPDSFPKVWQKNILGRLEQNSALSDTYILIDPLKKKKRKYSG